MEIVIKLEKYGVTHVNDYYNFNFSNIRKCLDIYDELFCKYGAKYFLLDTKVAFSKKNSLILNEIKRLEEGILLIYALPYLDYYRKTLISCFSEYTYYPTILKRLERARLKHESTIE